MDTSPRTPCVGFSGRCQRCERLDHHLSPGQRCPGEEAHDLNHEGEAIPFMATKRQDTTEDAHLIVRQAQTLECPFSKHSGLNHAQSYGVRRLLVEHVTECVRWCRGHSRVSPQSRFHVRSSLQRNNLDVHFISSSPVES